MKILHIITNTELGGAQRVCIDLCNSAASEGHSVAEKITKGKIKVIFDIDVPAEYAPNLNLNLNVDKLCSLGWKPSVGLEAAYRRMIAGIGK